MLTLEQARARASKVRAAFFDMDGTLLSTTTHTVPSSALATLQALRDAGVLLFIASGRPPAEIDPVLGGVFSFDGYVTMSGQYCYDAAGVFHNVTIDAHDVATIVSQAQAGLYGIHWSNETGSFAQVPKCQDLLALERDLNLNYPAGDINEVPNLGIHQFCAYCPAEVDHFITDACTHVRTMRWHPNFCDVVPADGGKDRGVLAALARHGLTAEQAVALGDGENDLDMLRCVGLSVAMGNASDAVKAEANWVTASCDNDGIARAAQDLGLV